MEPVYKIFNILSDHVTFERVAVGMQRIEIKPCYVRRARDLAAERNKSFEENVNWDIDMKSWGYET